MKTAKQTTCYIMSNAWWFTSSYDTVL